MRDVSADKERPQHVRLIPPTIICASHAIRHDIGDQHRGPFSLKRRAAIRAIEAEHADLAHTMLVFWDDLQIVDKMPRGYVAAALAPRIVGADFVVSFETIVADGEKTIREIIFVRLGAAAVLTWQNASDGTSVRKVPLSRK